MNTVSVALCLRRAFFVFVPCAAVYAITKKSSSREMATPLECGFDPYGSRRVPFSLRFFLIGIILVVFDVELAVLSSSPLILSGNSSEAFFGPVFFCFVLLVGLVYEWKHGRLN